MQFSLFAQLGYFAQPWCAAALPQLQSVVASELKGKKAGDEDRQISLELEKSEALG